MLHCGLTSVTFRKLTAEEIITLAQKAGLETVEWGGDIHVPVGDLATAKKVGNMTRAAGLRTGSYGSYYKCDGDFGEVSETACALGADVIRIWAGRLDAERCGEREFYALVEAIRRAADIAGTRGQTLAFEFHYGTYCNGAASCLRLLEAVDRKNVLTYWQPGYWDKSGKQFENDLASLGALREKIVNLHVYNWLGKTRLPLSDGEKAWSSYIAALGESDADCLLEFIRDDSPDSFFRDADTLKKMINSANG